jgi:hypothetical protein
MTAHIRTAHPYGHTPENTYTDFDWIRRHERELLAQYGECSILVYKEQVIGIGATYDEAIQNAERSLPPEMGEITPVHQWLTYRHPVSRLRSIK